MDQDRRLNSGHIAIGADTSLEEIEAMLFDDMVERGVPVEDAAELAPELAAKAAAQRDSYVKGAAEVATAAKVQQEVEGLRREVAALQRRLRHELYLGHGLLVLLVAAAAILITRAAFLAH